MTALQKRLYKISDAKYAAFQSKLTPGIDPELFIGVRVPVLRRFAKAFIKEPDCNFFLKDLPHHYYDENMLHGLLVSEMKDYDTIIEHLDIFLPYVDNWAVCDIMSPKALKKHKGKLIKKIEEWIASPHAYTCRFGIEMLMTFYLDDDFDSKYLLLPAAVRSDAYYVQMMVAWFFATALAKQWDAAVLYLKNNNLDNWTHNKTIQKARESRRITDEQKVYLKNLKRKDD